MSKVFICYSHKDDKYLNLLLKHLDNSLLDIWSDKRIEGAEHWEEEIKKALETCNCGVLILSANFFSSSFIQNIELKQLLQNKYEKNTYLIPVLAEYCDIDNYKWISKKEVLPKGFKPLEKVKKRNYNIEVVKIKKCIQKLLEKQSESHYCLSQESNISTINYPDAIEVNNFPTSNDKFFGREKYFDILDKVWSDEQVNILSFIAFGGIGKTSLIDNWLKRMKKDHYKGAKNIFMWSFYSQGTEEDRQVTATEFLLEACRFFKIKKIPKTSYEQGRELADIISKQRALIVLDGLEPLQSSLEDIGEIKDNGLQIFLKRLSRQNKGLVIITSRIRLASIDNQYEELEILKDFEGVELLKSFDLNGSIKELEQISKDFDGHALALKLLGSYIKVVLDKDINRIDEIENLTDDKTKSSKHANRMLNSYKKYLKGTVELEMLKLLGFFDRAISFEVIEVLKNKPLIESINDKLININEIDWKYTLNTLKELHLISDNNKFLDTHPLVREYFSKYIEENYKDSYIKGHNRLYQYYEKLPEKLLPLTIEEMEPLFHAVFHGCKAKKYNEVFERIYFYRINQGVAYYLTLTLSRFDLVLKLLNNFIFPFNKKPMELSYKYSLGIKGHISDSLFSMGKYKKALKIMDSITKKSFDNKDFNLFLSLLDKKIICNIILYDFNKVNKNFNMYSEYINKIDKSHYDSDHKANLLGVYAYYNFLIGDFVKSNMLFVECEDILVKNMNKGNVQEIMSINSQINIYGINAFYYFEYLLYINKLDEVEKKIKSSLLLAQKVEWIFYIGLNYLILGKLKLRKKEKEKVILRIFSKSIEFLRKSNKVFYLIKGLIAYSDAFRCCKYFNESREKLKESYDLIIYSDTKLLMADWYVVAIKLALDENDIKKANTNFKEVKALSKELNEYFIFKEELKKLELNYKEVLS